MKLVFCISTYEGIPITYRKVYEVVSTTPTHYIIIDDNGFERFQKKTRFIPLGETNLIGYRTRVEDEKQKAYMKGFKEGVKTATCDIRNSLINIEKQNGL